MTDEQLAMYDSLTCLDDEQWADTTRELVAEVRRLQGLVQQAEWAILTTRKAKTKSDAVEQ